MNKLLLIGMVVGGLALFGWTGNAQADHRDCNYGYSIGGSSAPRSSAVPSYNYYYSQPYYGYYSYPSYGGHHGLHFSVFGHGGYYGGGHYGGGHYGGGHFGGGHFGGGHFGGGHFGGGHSGGHHGGHR